MLFNKVIKYLANEDAKSCHTLIELSTNQWKRYGDNSIVVTGFKEQRLSKSNKHLKYSKVTLEQNVHIKKRFTEAKIRPFIGNVFGYKM